MEPKNVFCNCVLVLCILLLFLPQLYMFLCRTFQVMLSPSTKPPPPSFWGGSGASEFEIP